MPPEPDVENHLDFTRRAYLAEWMDEPCSYEDFRACLRDLAEVNRVTFAHRSTLQWLSRIHAQVAVECPLHIVDVGCGGGDLLRQIERWAAARGRAVTLTGIDLNPFAAQAAREFTPASSRIRWVTGDAFSYTAASNATEPVDLVVSSLFTHHLPDAEIVRFLQWMESTARLGWFINDLHRQAVPYRMFGVLARVARWHRFVQHDGPVSIRRAFREDDWRAYLLAAGQQPDQVRIAPVWPGRLCVSRVKP